MTGMVIPLAIFMVTSIIVASLPMQPPGLRMTVLVTHLVVTSAGIIWLFVPDGDSETIPFALAIFGPGAAIAVVRIVRTRRQLMQNDRN